jgi:K+-transporting ATPase KdpF subunit
MCAFVTTSRFTCAFATTFVVSAHSISRSNHMGTIIVGIIALLLFAYLFIAMIRPEKF